MLKLALRGYEPLTVCLVDGQYVRDNLYLDFTEGGNDMVYGGGPLSKADFILAGEIWLDFDVSAAEIEFVLLHELVERRTMIAGMDYDAAHEQANSAEEAARANPEKVGALIQECLQAQTTVAADIEQSIREEQKAVSDYRVRGERAKAAGDLETVAVYEHIGPQEAEHEAELSKRLTAKAYRSKAMANVIRKTYKAEVKGFNPDTGEVDVFIPLSKNTVDRDEEILLPSAFQKRIKTYQSRPVLVSSHDYKELIKQIGEFTELRITEDGLYGKPKYYINRGNQEADWGFFLASIGMASYSVGFIPYESEEPKDKSMARRVYTEVELLEISHVIIPSNRDAAQSMRDALTERGAKVPVPKGLIDALVKGPRKTTQAELRDELDFILTMANDAGIAAETKALAIKVCDEIRRLSGGDTPVSHKALTNKVKNLVKEASVKCNEGLSTMDAHHKAHNEAYKSHKAALEDALTKLAELTPDKEEEDEREEPEEKGILAAFQTK